MAVCKTKSIAANDLNYEIDFYEWEDKTDFFDLFERRRSVRHFKPKPVTKEEIDKILHILSTAPHGTSEPHVEITVINSRAKIMEALPYFSEFYHKLGKWLYNPFVRFMIKKQVGADGLKTLIQHVWPRIKLGIYNNGNEQYDGITRGAHTILLFHANKMAEEHKEDAYIYVSFAAMAAQALGLGSTIVGLIPPAINKSKKLKQLFNIPIENECVISLIVGYPKYKYLRGIKRQLKNVEFIS
jgi:nitroreductase